MVLSRHYHPAAMESAAQTLTAVGPSHPRARLQHPFLLRLLHTQLLIKSVPQKSGELDTSRAQLHKTLQQLGLLDPRFKLQLTSALMTDRQSHLPRGWRASCSHPPAMLAPITAAPRARGKCITANPICQTSKMRPVS